jgi:hypothetical protein
METSAMTYVFLFVLLGVLLVNLPFGMWRVRAKRFSLAWFAAVHLPVPLVVCMRLLSGMGWKLWTFPFMIGAYFAGQYVGGRLAARGRSLGE